jgi:hypothetical protein
MKTMLGVRLGPAANCVAIVPPTEARKDRLSIMQEVAYSRAGAALANTFY